MSDSDQTQSRGEAVSMGLEAVDWENLSHAYGVATDVPGLLRALRSESQFEKASYELWGNVFHQGTRYEATSHVVPFLYELLRDEAAPPRLTRFLLTYLHHLALGYPGDAFPQWDVAECAQGEFEARAYASVERGLEGVFRFVDSTDDEISETACALLATFPARADVSRPRLMEVLGHTDGNARGYAVLALALLGDDVAVHVLRLLATGERIVRVYAACAAALARAPEVSDDVVTALVTPLGDLQSKASAFANDMAALVGAALSALPDEHTTTAIRALARAHEHASPMSTLQLTSQMLALALREPLPTDASTLTANQRIALAAVADHGAWALEEMMFANYVNLVGAYGLPRSRDALKAWMRG